MSNRRKLLLAQTRKTTSPPVVKSEPTPVSVSEPKVEPKVEPVTKKIPMVETKQSKKKKKKSKK